MRLFLLRTLVVPAIASIATSAAIAREPPPPKRFGVVIQPDGIEFRKSCKGAQPFEHCKMYTKSYVRPQLLKRRGILYGVRGLDIMPNCKGAEVFDFCKTYAVSGTVESVGYYMNTRLISDFTLRTRSGRRKIQNVSPWDLPRIAYVLIQPGRRVRVTGELTGMGRVTNVDEITLDRRR